MKTLILLPFKIAWFLIKMVLTIALLFAGPVGWGIIAGWWFAGKMEQPRPVYVVDKDK